MTYSNLDVSEMFVERQGQRSSMHARHLNEQLVRVLKTIGYDVGFQKGQGQYLFDRDGVRYLDLLSGFGVFAIGRNHPALRQALKSVIDADLPNLVQLDVSTLAGVLAERLLKYVPYLDKVFFANSGAECVEAAVSTRVFSVSLGGFDFHAEEKVAQERLLGQLDSALSGFMERLGKTEDAADFYAKLAADFPDDPNVAAATDRLAALRAGREGGTSRR